VTYPSDINYGGDGNVVRIKTRRATSQSRGKAPPPDQILEDDVSMPERAYRQIEELIITLQLPPGMVLSEQMLVQRLNIGRTPIREALQRLARDGLVLILPRRGILVSEINVRTQLRVLEVRRELERLLARLAAERATADERAGFEQIAEGMLAASANADDIAFVRLDHQFNALLSQAARNEFATRSLALMHGLSRRFWYQHYKEVADLPLAAKLHAEVALAVAHRDPAGAAAASDRLIDYIQEFARKTIEA
jgi:DNA-binding GntR family transcriptional regulator